MLYSAVIGDIVSSRILTERKVIQQQFLSMVELGNRLYADDIAANFTITLGDEFEVLLHNTAASFKIVQFVRQQMAPLELAVGIGIGQVSTDIDRNFAGLSDGPAFYLAREAVKIAKRNRSRTQVKGDIPGIELINALIAFIQTCQNRTTSHQKRVVSLMLALNNQKKVAEMLSIKQSSVSKTLSAAYYYEINNAYIEIENYLKQVCGND